MLRSTPCCSRKRPEEERWSCACPADPTMKPRLEVDLWRGGGRGGHSRVSAVGLMPKRILNDLWRCQKEAMYHGCTEEVQVKTTCAELIIGAVIIDD